LGFTIHLELPSPFLQPFASLSSFFPTLFPFFFQLPFTFLSTTMKQSSINQSILTSQTDVLARHENLFACMVSDDIESNIAAVHEPVIFVVG